METVPVLMYLNLEELFSHIIHSFLFRVTKSDINKIRFCFSTANGNYVFNIIKSKQKYHWPVKNSRFLFTHGFVNRKWKMFSSERKRNYL